MEPGVARPGGPGAQIGHDPAELFEGSRGGCGRCRVVSGLGHALLALPAANSGGRGALIAETNRADAPVPFLGSSTPGFLMG